MTLDRPTSDADPGRMCRGAVFMALQSWLEPNRAASASYRASSRSGWVQSPARLGCPARLEIFA